jgi:predicted heme/steroid binding protein
MFGDDDPEIAEWDYGVWPQEVPAVAINIARYARETQGLDYKTGPAVVSETDDDPFPIRINAMLELLHYEGRMGDATLHFQEPGYAYDITDDHLHRNHMYVANHDILSATRHALAFLKLARQDEAFAHELWPYPPDGRP